MVKWLEKNRKISLIVTILLMIEIFYFSSLQGNIGIGPTINLSTVYHFVVFFLFSFFLFATIKTDKKIKTRHILIILVISIIYGILDEVHQMFVPFRNASIRDILINNLGIFSSILIYLYIDNKSKV